MANLYNLYEIEPFSDMAAVKKAYHRLIKRVHPDLNPSLKGGALRFMEYREAFRILGDPDKKRVYDQKLLLELTNGQRHSSKKINRRHISEWPKNTGQLWKSFLKWLALVLRRPIKTRCRICERHEVVLTPFEAHAGCLVPLRLFNHEMLVRIPPNMDDGARLTVLKPGCPTTAAEISVRVLRADRPLISVRIPIGRLRLGRVVEFMYRANCYRIKLSKEVLKKRYITLAECDIRICFDEEMLNCQNVVESSVTLLNNISAYEEALR